MKAKLLFQSFLMALALFIALFTVIGLCIGFVVLIAVQPLWALCIAVVGGFTVAWQDAYKFLGRREQTSKNFMCQSHKP